MKGKDWREELTGKRQLPPSSGLFASPDEPYDEVNTSKTDEKETIDIQQEDITHNSEVSNSLNWERYRIRIGDVIKADEPILMIGRLVFASRGNIQTISGKPKSCKTFLTSAMASACVSGESLGMTSPDKTLKVLMFDTEQGDSRAQKVQQRVYRMGGLKSEKDDDRIIVVSVRQLDPKKRLGILKKAMVDTKPDLVILDGVRDLLTDFNSVTESAELVNVLMKLSVDFNCAIVTVIHQNKGDLNARGHLGSELMNKSETAMEVQRADKTSTVRPVFCRNIEFEEFSFWINQEGLPELCDTPPNKENKEEELRKLVNKAMFGSSQMLKLDLRKKLEETTGLTVRTANRRIAEAIRGHILKVVSDDSKMVRLVVELDNAPDEDDSTPEDDLPF